MSNINIPSWIKAELFENALRETIEDLKQIKNFKVFPALAPGENYTTIMLKVQTDVVLINGAVKKQSFMLKVSLDTELYHNEMSKWEMFITESGMYRYIKPELEKLYAQADQNIDFGAKSYELPIAKEYILLEDLSVRGFKNVKRQDCLDLEHCQAVLKKIAQFHAASAVRVEQKGMFDKIYLYGFLIEESKNFLKTLFDTSLPHLIKAMNKLDNCSECSDEIQKLSSNVVDTVFDQCKMCECDFNVLNHGDCWSNNIMFKYDSEGNLEETYLVDLQMPRYGSPAQDLLFFIISSAHEDIKIEKFDYMIKYYHDHLIDHLKLLNYTKTLPSLRSIQESLIKHGIWGLFAVITVMGVVLCEPTDSANIDNFVCSSEEGDRFKEILYSNDRYVKHLKLVVPWLCNRGAFEC